MDKIAKAVNWLAASDCDESMTNRQLLTMLFVFAIRLITVALLLYALQMGVAGKLLELLRAIGAVYLARTLRLG